MAIYHLNAQVISRAKGRSATAAAAYRAAESITDVRTGLVFNYKRKQEVVFKAIYAPINVPAWCRSRPDLWNQAEQAEVRRDAQVARELNVALPRELSRQAQIALLKQFVESQFVTNGMVADVAIHSKADGCNPHAHILLTLRTITSSGFGNKCRSWNGRNVLEVWREEWALHCNKALQAVGAVQRIDHRTLLAQKIKRVPTVHEGARWDASVDVTTFNYETNTTIKELNMETSMKLADEQRTREAVATPSKLKYQIASNKAPHLFISARGENVKDRARVIHSADYTEALMQLLGPPAPQIEWEQSPLGGCWHIQLADGEVYDYGSQIKCASGSREEIATAVAIAKRNNWSGLQLTGDADFKRRAFIEAVAQGFDATTITGYKATSLDVEVGMALREDRQENQKHSVSGKPVSIEEEGTGTRVRKTKLKP